MNSEQKTWLIGKFPLFLHHQVNKTTSQFFPSLYEEYFEQWTPIPREEDISQAGGNVEVATAALRQYQENVRDFGLTALISSEVNCDHQQRIYRWMHNRTRSKQGVKGQGSYYTLNLTGGPPKKKAALQAYVKYFWESKIKKKVIELWAPTPETDLFREIENGEDQVAWEAMTPMEKNIPLWFRMDVGRKLYDAEPEEVKAEVDRLREQEKLDAVATLNTSFVTDEERLRVMQRFDG